MIKLLAQWWSIWALGIITVVVIVLDELEVRQRRRCMRLQLRKELRRGRE